MKSLMISIPASLIVGLLVGKLALTCMQVEVTAGGLATAVILCTALLIRRPALELCFIGAISILAEMHLRGMGGLQISEDALLALIITVILLPTALSVMGIHNPFRSASM